MGLQFIYHVLIAAGNVIFIAAVAGGGKKGATAVPIHAAPAQGHRVCLGAKIQLRVGRNGVIGMDPGIIRPDLFINAQEHCGGLCTGGGGVRRKGGGRGSLGHADIIGNGNVSLAGGNICKRQVGFFFHQRCRRTKTKGTHQHFCHFAPGDGIIGTEGAVGIHHIMLCGGVDGTPIHILEVRIQRHGIGHIGCFPGRPGEHAAQYRCKLRTGHRIFEAKEAVSVSVHETVFSGLFYFNRQNIAGGNIGVGSFRGRHCDADSQSQVQNCGKIFFHAASLLFFRVSMIPYPTIQV